MGVRGGTTPASDKVILLVNGQEMTVEMLGSAVWNMQHFSMDDIERVEVIRGPGSALYGANAYSGVVNVTTRRPGEGPPVSFSLRGGEHGTFELAGRASGNLGRVALALSAGRQRENLAEVRGMPGREVLYSRLTGRLGLGKENALVIESGILQSMGDAYLINRIELDQVLHFFVRGQINYRNFSFKCDYATGIIQGQMDLKMFVEELKQTIARLPPIDTDLGRFSAFADYFFELFHNRITFGAEATLDRYHNSVTIPQNFSGYRVGVFLQDEVQLGALFGNPALRRTAGWCWRSCWPATLPPPSTEESNCPTGLPTTSRPRWRSG